MSNKHSYLEQLKGILSDLPKYDKTDSFGKDSLYDEAKEVADWFQKELEAIDYGQDQERVEEIGSDWRQRLSDLGSNGAVEFRNIVRLLPKDAEFVDVSQALHKLQETKVDICFSDPHWREKCILAGELKRLKRDCSHDVEWLLNRIEHYPFLSKNEEWVLVILAQSNNIEARNRIVLSYLQFVIAMAQKYEYSGLPLMDLIQEGCLGLIQAIYKYDPLQSRRLYNYAHWWVRQAIQRAASEKSSLIRLPVHIVDQINHLRWVRPQLENKLGRQITVSDIAGALEINPDKAKQLATWLDVSFIPLSEISKQDDDCNSFLADTSLIEMGEVTSDREALLEHIKSLLNRREWTILNYRFGLEGSQTPETLESIGKKLNLSRQRVSQIQTEILERLRKVFTSWEFYRHEPLTRHHSSGSSGEQTHSSPETSENREKKSRSRRNNPIPRKPERKAKVGSWDEHIRKSHQGTESVFDWFIERVGHN